MANRKIDINTKKNNTAEKEPTTGTDDKWNADTCPTIPEEWKDKAEQLAQKEDDTKNKVEFMNAKAVADEYEYSSKDTEACRINCKEESEDFKKTNNALAKNIIINKHNNKEEYINLGKTLDTITETIKDTHLRTPDAPATTIVNNNVRSYNVGTSNYSNMSLQPWDVWIAWDLNPWDADIIKRIARTKVEKGLSELEARKMDYEKIIHDAKECIRQIENGIYKR